MIENEVSTELAKVFTVGVERLGGEFRESYARLRELGGDVAARGEVIARNVLDLLRRQQRGEVTPELASALLSAEVDAVDFLERAVVERGKVETVKRFRGAISILREVAPAVIKVSAGAIGGAIGGPLGGAVGDAIGRVAGEALGA